MSVPAEAPGHCGGDARELASRRWTRVWRAALVLPWGLVGLKVSDLRGETLPPSCDPRAPGSGSVDDRGEAGRAPLPLIVVPTREPALGGRFPRQIDDHPRQGRSSRD